MDAVGFAERILTIVVRSDSLQSEIVLSNVILLEMALHIILIGYIFLDIFVCTNNDNPGLISDPYISQVCGTEIRSEAYLFYLDRVLFLLFIISVFFLNKWVVNRVNRYHSIIMREKLEFINKQPIYTDVNYYFRWKIAIIVYILYKIIAILILSLLITGSVLVLTLVPVVHDMITFSGITCGPNLMHVDDIPTRQLCHFQHEFVITVLVYITNIFGFFIWFLHIITLVSIFYYFLRFRYQLQRQSLLDRELLTYEVLACKEESTTITPPTV